MTIGERIAALRRAAGLSQEQLAELLEVSRQAVSKWETGQTQPEADRIPRICAVFSVSADELLGIIPHTPVQETVQEERKDVEVLLRAGLYRRVFTVGSCIAAGGLVVLAIAYGGVWAVYHRALEIAFEYGMGFRSDMMYYARTMPMAAVFVLGGIMVMCGIVLAAYGLYKGGKHSRCGKKQENAR